ARKPAAQSPGGPPENRSSIKPIISTAKGGIRSGRTRTQKYTAARARTGAGRTPPVNDTGILASITSNRVRATGRADDRKRKGCVNKCSNISTALVTGPVPHSVHRIEARSGSAIEAARY